MPNRLLDTCLVLINGEVAHWEPALNGKVNGEVCIGSLLFPESDVPTLVYSEEDIINLDTAPADMVERYNNIRSERQSHY
tara:strand:+ start:332 stop:571 length:240 start_codon:yes stop_codon:yes gene_type:complete